MGSIDSQIQQLSIVLPGVLLAITVHEFAHGWVANRLGDPTARLAGRLTMNPFAHLDLIGGLALLLFHFGWAKPVPINPLYFKNPRQGIVLTSLAGAASNLLTASIIALIYRMVFAPSMMFVPALLPRMVGPLNLMLIRAVEMNVFFGFFNLIPIPPLDGSKVVMGFLPPAQANALDRLEPYGVFILMFLILIGAIGAVIGPPAVMLIRLLLAM